MKMVFASNYFNHHQRPFCDEMYKKLGMGFYFVSTGAMDSERIKLGYKQDDVPPYVLLAYTSKKAHETALTIIREADVVLAGDTPEEYIAERLRMGRLVLRYSERPFKKEPSCYRKLYHWIRFRKRDKGSKNVYILCASAYAAADFASMGMYKDRMYKWGYFPDVSESKIEVLRSEKKQNTILWCGRFISWKHPDVAVKVAQKLKEKGYHFQLIMIGNGEMETELKRMAKVCGVADVVQFLGPMPPEQVRTHMDKAGIYLFTSDRQEGWGAVLNEAMASGCAVVASDAAGATPYLIQDGKNGIVYRSGDFDMLCDKIQYLLSEPKEQTLLGNMAYRTIMDTWNSKVASERLLQLIDQLLRKEGCTNLFGEGPCSREM